MASKSQSQTAILMTKLNIIINQWCYSLPTLKTDTQFLSLEQCIIDIEVIYFQVKSQVGWTHIDRA